MSGKLQKLAEELGVPVKNIGDLDPEIKELLENYSKQHEEALQKGEEFRVNPLTNVFAKCPNCGSREYFPLFGGRCKYRCAECGTDYACVEEGEYFKRLERGR
jgi:transposase-like protein